MNEALLDISDDQPSISIEKASPDDAEAIVEIRRQGWLSAYPNPDYGISYENVRKRIEGENGEHLAIAAERWHKGIKEDMASGRRANFVAKLNGKVVGYTAPHVINGQQRLGALYVLPEAQGKGVGRQLLQAAINWYGRDEDIFLRVVSYNQKAIDLYNKFGFRETGNNIEGIRIDDQEALPEIEMKLPKIQ